MPTFCWQQDESDETGSVGAWGSCDTGFQWAWSALYVCVDVDEASCSDGPFYAASNYQGDHAGWLADTGLVMQQVPNALWTSGEATGGGGGEEGWLPSLTLAEGGLIAAAIAGLWALGMCLRFIRKMLEES